MRFERNALDHLQDHIEWLSQKGFDKISEVKIEKKKVYTERIYLHCRVDCLKVYPHSTYYFWRPLCRDGDKIKVRERSKCFNYSISSQIFRKRLISISYVPGVHYFIAQIHYRPVSKRTHLQRQHLVIHYHRPDQLYELHR